MSLIMARMPMVQKFRSVLVLISEQRPGQSHRSETSSEDHAMLKRFLTMTASVIALATPAAAHTAQAGSDTVTPVFEHTIPNIPGKSLVSVVDYPPGGSTEPHLHAKSAFIYAHVLSGAIRSQVDDGADKVYQAGESFFETPGAYHRISENASTTEPARLLAVFVLDAGENPLTIPHAH
jgi:quercetin dioxygenase-like cupin family protein